MQYEDVFRELEEVEWGLLGTGMKAGHYAFFIASGLSKEAGLPTGSELSEKLIRNIHVRAANPVQKFRETHNYNGALDLPIVTELIERKEGREKLIQLLRDSINWDVDPHYAHRFLNLIALEMKERQKAIRIITTNYDTLVEDSLPPKREVIVLEEQYIEAEDARPWVLKIHGCINTNPHVTIKITQTELEQPLDPWKQKLVEHCLRGKGLIIVGYGATDIYVSKTINEAIRTSRNPSYWISTGQPPEEVIKSLAESKGRFISMDAKTFFETARIIEQNRSMENHA